MKKISLLFLLFFLVWVGSAIGTDLGQFLKRDGGQVLNTKTLQSEPEAPAIPQTIQIPKINVEAPLESVGLDNQKRMDVPKDPDNAAWYNLGPKPGEKGNAAIAGHLDHTDGSPAIFWNLEDLSVGDTIIITDANGKEYTFSVTRTATYPYDDFPLEEVFGKTDRPMLNLITCKGAWDSAQRNYSHRVVVYSELIE